MRQLIRVTATLAMLTLSGCATMETGSFIDHVADFTRYQTYNWAPAARPSGDPRLEKNAVFLDRLQGEIEKQLAVKGLRGPVSRNPDLLIRYRAAVTPRTQINGGSSGYGYGYCSSDCFARIEEYEAATLVLDIVDARTRKVIWRGWSRDNLDQFLGNQDRMGRRIHEAVTQMMAKFPSNA